MQTNTATQDGGGPPQSDGTYEKTAQPARGGRSLMTGTKRKRQRQSKGEESNGKQANAGIERQDESDGNQDKVGTRTAAEYDGK